MDRSWGISKRLPRLLLCFCDSCLLLCWNRTRRLGRSRIRQPSQGPSRGDQAGLLAHHSVSIPDYLTSPALPRGDTPPRKKSILVLSLTCSRFYVLGLSLVGLLVSSTDERLLNAKNPYAEGVSPFVLAVLDAGLNGYDDFMNVVICISVVSIGVSCVYGGSRTISALAHQGYAPKAFKYIDRSGRPLVSVVFVLLWGPIAYIVLASAGSIVFDWLLALTGLATLFTWGSICVVSRWL